MQISVFCRIDKREHESIYLHVFMHILAFVCFPSLPAPSVIQRLLSAASFTAWLAVIVHICCCKIILCCRCMIMYSLVLMRSQFQQRNMWPKFHGPFLVIVLLYKEVISIIKAIPLLTLRFWKSGMGCILYNFCVWSPRPYSLVLLSTVFRGITARTNGIKHYKITSSQILYGAGSTGRWTALQSRKPMLGNPTEDVTVREGGLWHKVSSPYAKMRQLVVAQTQLNIRFRITQMQRAESKQFPDEMCEKKWKRP